MKYRKKSVVIEATQWFKNGDHPDDGPCESVFEPAYEPTSPHEGEVVRYFRRPGWDTHHPCPECKRSYHDHGWIDTLEGGHTVCPGDFIITGVKGELYPCKPDIFEATYELVEETVEAYQRGHTDGSNDRLAEFKRAAGLKPALKDPSPFATPMLLRPDPATGLTPDEAQREKNRLTSERLDALRKPS